VDGRGSGIQGQSARASSAAVNHEGHEVTKQSFIGAP
jgi:hypothetical protein